MAAKKNNSYWKFRKKHGRKRAFADVAEFELWWCEYFQWCDRNPWYRNEALKSGNRAGELVQVPTSRPYTESGFVAFHGLGGHYLRQLDQSLQEREDQDSKDISEVLTWARNVCYSQKFEGAVIGAFNANIIARDLRLIDRTDHTTNGKDMLTKVPTEELKNRIQELLKKAE